MVNLVEHEPPTQGDLSLCATADVFRPERRAIRGLVGQPGQVRIRVDKKDWAIVPARREQGAGPDERAHFVCDLPIHAAITGGVVEAISLQTGESLGTLKVHPGACMVNGAGLLASQVLATHDQPLYAAPTITFDGRTITISGCFLPPHGDPGLLQVQFGPGVAFEFEYPLPAPEYEHHFWYWPNALHSGFRVKIDLPASKAASDPFTFDFVFPESLEDVRTLARRRVYIPCDLRGMIGFPLAISQIQRAQSFESFNSVANTGYQVFRTLEHFLHRHGVSATAGVKVLDFGCGHGRVIRHFIRHWRNASFAGTDIDPQNLAWCRRGLPEGDFRQGPLWPPSPYPDNSFDAIFGVSVMTHLTAIAQQAWLGELARMLKPGGVLLLTFCGPAAASYSSIFRDQEWWRHWLSDGFDDTQLDPTLDDLIEDKSYFRNTLQTEADVRRRWVEHFDIVEIAPDEFGYQSLAVLRPKAS